jgi:GNAT superfamily N-acetyltransferase
MTPEYVGLPPESYRGYALGFEKIMDVWGELIPLAQREWDEVGDDLRIGEFDPDAFACAQYQLQARMGVVTVRKLGGFQLVGYFVGMLSKPVKTSGQVWSEVGIYIAPEARTPFLASRLLRYTEQAARFLGADAVIIAHRPEHDRIGALYARAGYSPVSIAYMKRL